MHPPGGVGNTHLVPRLSHCPFQRVNMMMFEDHVLPRPLLAGDLDLWTNLSRTGGTEGCNASTQDLDIISHAPTLFESRLPKDMVSMVLMVRKVSLNYGFYGLFMVFMVPMVPMVQKE